jgi:hypothetical protein
MVMFHRANKLSCGRRSRIGEARKPTCGSRKPVASINQQVGYVSLRCSALIVVMQPIHFWNFPDRANLSPLDQPR